MAMLVAHQSSNAEVQKILKTIPSSFQSDVDGIFKSLFNVEDNLSKEKLGNLVKAQKVNLAGFINFDATDADGNMTIGNRPGFYLMIDKESYAALATSMKTSNLGAVYDEDPDTTYLTVNHRYAINATRADEIKNRNSMSRMRELNRGQSQQAGQQPQQQQPQQQQQQQQQHANVASGFGIDASSLGINTGASTSSSAASGSNNTSTAVAAPSTNSGTKERKHDNINHTASYATIHPGSVIPVYMGITDWKKGIYLSVLGRYLNLLEHVIVKGLNPTIDKGKADSKGKGAKIEYYADSVELAPGFDNIIDSMEIMCANRPSLYPIPWMKLSLVAKKVAAALSGNRESEDMLSERDLRNASSPTDATTAPTPTLTVGTTSIEDVTEETPRETIDNKGTTKAIEYPSNAPPASGAIQTYDKQQAQASQAAAAAAAAAAENNGKSLVITSSAIGRLGSGVLVNKEVNTYYSKALEDIQKISCWESGLMGTKGKPPPTKEDVVSIREDKIDKDKIWKSLNSIFPAKELSSLTTPFLFPLTETLETLGDGLDSLGVGTATSAYLFKNKPNTIGIMSPFHYEKVLPDNVTKEVPQLKFRTFLTRIFKDDEGRLKSRTDAWCVVVKAFACALLLGITDVNMWKLMAKHHIFEQQYARLLIRINLPYTVISDVNKTYKMEGDDTSGGGGEYIATCNMAFNNLARKICESYYKIPAAGAMELITYYINLRKGQTNMTSTNMGLVKKNCPNPLHTELYAAGVINVWESNNNFGDDSDSLYDFYVAPAGKAISTEAERDAYYSIPDMDKKSFMVLFNSLLKLSESKAEKLMPTGLKAGSEEFKKAKKTAKKQAEKPFEDAKDELEEFEIPSISVVEFPATKVQEAYSNPNCILYAVMKPVSHRYCAGYVFKTLTPVKDYVESIPETTLTCKYDPIPMDEEKAPANDNNNNNNGTKASQADAERLSREKSTETKHETLHEGLTHDKAKHETVHDVLSQDKEGNKVKPASSSSVSSSATKATASSKKDKMEIDAKKAPSPKRARTDKEKEKEKDKEKKTLPKSLSSSQVIMEDDDDASMIALMDGIDPNEFSMVSDDTATIVEEPEKEKEAEEEVVVEEEEEEVEVEAEEEEAEEEAEEEESPPTTPPPPQKRPAGPFAPASSQVKRSRKQ